MRYFDRALAHFRGNLHLHTTRSDGMLSPQEAIRLYAKADYDFLAITDHWHAWDEEDSYEQMAIFPGIELNADPDPYQTAHIIGFGVTSAIEAAANRSMTPQQLIDAIRQVGGFALLAHPAWSLNTEAFIASLHGLIGAEVFNSVSRTPWNGDRADSSGILDVAAVRGVVLPFIGNDDAHFYTGEQLGAWTVVQCSEPTPQKVAEAIAAGHSYASQGPDFYKVELDGDRLIIECSPVSTITFYSNLFYTKDRCTAGKNLTGAHYAIKETETFIRCQITDAQGRHAWSSPIRL